MKYGTKHLTVTRQSMTKNETLIKMTNGITFFMYFFSCGNLLSSVDITLLSGKPLFICIQTTPLHSPVLITPTATDRQTSSNYIVG